MVFENNVVGAFNQFEWEGAKKGLKYHDYLPTLPPDIKYQKFSLGDFLKVFCLPFFSGLLFLIFGTIIYWIMKGSPGAFPFFLFHAGVSYYLMASFDFHTNYHASAFFLLNFAFLPAFMSLFAFYYPERPRFLSRHRLLVMLPCLTSGILSFPYLYTFFKNPLSWPFWEAVIVVYAAFSYLFWIGRLSHVANHPQNEANRITAKYLLFGQCFSFVFPLFLAVGIFVFDKNVPLNWVAPTTLVFPIAALFGMTLGRLKRTQMELITSEKMALLGQLLAGVAHEINNPTTFIYANLAPLKDYLAYLKQNILGVPQNPPQPPFVKGGEGGFKKFRGEMDVSEVMDDLENLVGNIEEGAQRTKQIVVDLRNFGHSQNDVIGDVPLLPGIQSTLNILSHQWKGRIQIHVDCPEDLIVRANPGQLSQVWMNLLANAIHAMEGEGEIWVTGRKKKDRIIVSIKDTGCGISSEKMRKIFDPFFTTKEQGEGTGLGLSIVQQIVKKFSGTIDVKSETGKGTEFIIRFGV